MSYITPVKDDSLIEEKPINVSKGWIGIHFCRRGLAYKNAQKDDYKLIKFEKNDIPLFEEVAPPYFKEIESLCFYKKGIRDGFIYIYDPDGKFWLMYKVTGHKCRLITESDSEIAQETADKIGKTTESSYLKLPEKDKYYVAFSSAGWTRDYLDSIVKKVESGNTIFTLIDVAAWKKANKAKSPKTLPATYTFNEDMYELQGKHNDKNIGGNIESSGFSNAYLAGAEKASKYGKQKILYFTIDDTLGVAEDLQTEMIRFILYKEAYNRAVQMYVPVSEILNKQRSEREGSDDEYRALYSSTAILYNMLYSTGGGLNQTEHQHDKENDNKHKYQSKVQKYKLTKLLAVNERKALQQKYAALRDLLGRIMSSDEYEKEIEPFLRQSEMIKFAGQSLLMDHLKLLYIQPDCFDSDISLNDESGKDKWRQLIEDMVMAYMKIEDEDIKKIDSPVIKLLNQVIVFETLVKSRDSSTPKLSNTGEGVSLTDNSLKSLILSSLRISTTVLLGIIKRKREKNIDIGRAINKLFAQNIDIVSNRKMKISDVLSKYNINHTPEMINNLYNKQSENIKGKGGKTKKEKIKKGIQDAKAYKRRKFNRNIREIDVLEIEVIEVRETLPKWMEAKEYIEGINHVISVVNMATAGIKVLSEITDENKQVTSLDMIYYGLYIFGSSFDYMKSTTQFVEIVNIDVAKVFGLKSAVRMKALSGMAKNLVADVIIFAAECVNSYRMLRARNHWAATYNMISASLSLMSAVCLTAAFMLTGIGVVVLIIAAIGLAVAAYFTGERAGKLEYDLWQSFLINSIFSNYVGKTGVFSRINTKLEEDINSKYYEISNDLYDMKSEIAINNYYYKNKEYNLQNFIEMLQLLDEMSVCFEVNVALRTSDYSYDNTRNYIIPTNLAINMSYFGITRFDSVDYFLYIDVFPEGNQLGVILKGGVELNPMKEEDTISEYGQSEFILTFNLWQALHNIANGIRNNKEDAEVLKEKDILSADGTKIIYPSSMTITFGCRLVNSTQEITTDLPALRDTSTITIDALPNAEFGNNNRNDGKRAYLPWEKNGTEIFRGFKSRVGMPVPADTGDFSARYWRYIHSHMVSGIGTMEDLVGIKLRDIAYDTKENKKIELL